MEEKIILKHNRNVRLAQHCHHIFYGRTRELSYDPETNTSYVEPKTEIDEMTFYYLYCSINNISEPPGKTIAATQLLVLSALMAKPLDFTLPIDSKAGTLTDLAEELSTEEDKRTSNSIYQSVKRLRDKGYLIETEDRLIVPAAKFQYVRRVIKKQLQEQGYATFDYLFKCFVKKLPEEDGQGNGTDNSGNSGGTTNTQI